MKRPQPARCICALISSAQIQSEDAIVARRSLVARGLLQTRASRNAQTRRRLTFPSVCTLGLNPSERALCIVHLQVHKPKKVYASLCFGWKRDLILVWRRLASCCKELEPTNGGATSAHGIEQPFKVEQASGQAPG